MLFRNIYGTGIRVKCSYLTIFGLQVFFFVTGLGDFFKASKSDIHQNSFSHFSQEFLNWIVIFFIVKFVRPDSDNLAVHVICWINNVHRASDWIEFVFYFLGNVSYKLEIFIKFDFWWNFKSQDPSAHNAFIKL